jgi:hypothetical protein
MMRQRLNRCSFKSVKIKYGEESTKLVRVPMPEFWHAIVNEMRWHIDGRGEPVQVPPDVELDDLPLRIQPLKKSVRTYGLSRRTTHCNHYLHSPGHERGNRNPFFTLQRLPDIATQEPAICYVAANAVKF